jgi:hypothetical protein
MRGALRREGQVAGIGEMRNVCRVVIITAEGRDFLEDRSISGVLIKMDLQESVRGLDLCVSEKTDE